MSEFFEISYIIDAQDRIISVSPQWAEFAKCNGGENLAPQNVVGQPLWKFIEDQPTRELYQEILSHVRSGAGTELVLRCDSPRKRRLIDLNVRQVSGGMVEFRTKLLSCKERPPQRLFDPSTPRTSGRIMVCSWCDLVCCKDEWVEVETAMERLNLANASELPRTNPVVCPACYGRVIEILEESKSAAAR